MQKKYLQNNNNNSQNLLKKAHLDLISTKISESIFYSSTSNNNQVKLNKVSLSNTYNTLH